MRRTRSGARRVAAAALVWVATTLVASNAVTSSSSSGSASMDSVRDDAGATIDVPLPGWLQGSSVLGALTSSVHTIPANGDALVDGVVIRIAPRFVVTAASLLSARGLKRLRNTTIESRTVLFNGGAASVMRVVFESDFYGTHDDPLVVLELSDEPVGAPLSRVITSKPNKDFEYEKLSMLNVGSLLDTKAWLAEGVQGRVVDTAPTKETKLTFFVEPMCGYTTPPAGDSDSISDLCVGSLNRTMGASFFDSDKWPRRRALASAENPRNPLPPNASTSLGPSRLDKAPNRHNDDHNKSVGVTGMSSAVGMGAVGATELQGALLTMPSVLLYGDNVVGLSIAVLTAPRRFQTPRNSKRGFVRLAAPRHRAFLDAVTHYTTQYDDDDVFSKLSKYPSYLATFLDATGRKLPCHGVLISPQHVLTTASCLAAYEDDLRGVQFFASDAAEREIVNVDRTRMAAHPRFVDGHVTYDTAVVALERAVRRAAPIQLDDGSADESTSFARLQMGDDDQCVVSASVAATGAGTCHAASDDALGGSAGVAFCVKPASGARDFSAKRFVGDDAIAQVDTALPRATAGAALVAVTQLSSVALVGLAVSSYATTASRRLEDTTTNGELYVRVANSAPFINAYVTGASWSPVKTLQALDVASVVAANDVDLPQDDQFVVGLRTTRDGQNYCGGSLIGPTTVLTAAHCVQDGPVQFVSIGAYSSSGVDTEVIAVVASKTVRHPQYSVPHAFSYDVAVLELAFASAVAPVALDDTADFPAVPRTTATMYGYGVTSATSGLSPTLRAVAMPLWSRAACRAVFGADVDESMLCAGGQKGMDACTGDSGSPLVIKNNAGKHVLVGVVSAGAGCGLENVPGVYARIHSVKAFVNAHVIGVAWDTDSSSRGTDSDTGEQSEVTGSRTDGVAMEAREAGSQAAAATATTTTTTTPATGPYYVARLDLSTLTPLVRNALVAFLLDAASEQVMGRVMVDALGASENVLQLYSTARLDALLAIVVRHNQLPLSTRRDRFDRWKNADASASISRSGDACTAG